MSIDVLGIDHIGIAVKDLPQAIKTYRDTLGLRIVGREKLDSRGLEVCFIDAGQSRLELLGETRTPTEISKFLETRGEGIHHICLRVGDIEDAVQRLVTQGAQVIGEGIQEGAHRSRVAFIHPKSTHGVLLELVEQTHHQEQDDES
ncbi:MAG: methylmalonyl-CoA epimerase [Myxococcota bacterium]